MSLTKDDVEVVALVLPGPAAAALRAAYFATPPAWVQEPLPRASLVLLNNPHKPLALLNNPEADEDPTSRHGRPGFAV